MTIKRTIIKGAIFLGIPFSIAIYGTILNGANISFEAITALILTLGAGISLTIPSK